MQLSLRWYYSLATGLCLEWTHSRYSADREGRGPAAHASVRLSFGCRLFSLFFLFVLASFVIVFVSEVRFIFRRPLIYVLSVLLRRKHFFILCCYTSRFGPVCYVFCLLRPPGHYMFDLGASGCLGARRRRGTRRRHRRCAGPPANHERENHSQRLALANRNVALLPSLLYVERNKPGRVLVSLP